MRYLPLVFLAATLLGCQPEQSAAPAPAAAPDPTPAPAPDMHTSQNALDWAGTYEGVLACADCAGIHTRLTLAGDGSFELYTRRLARGATAAMAQGQFEWEPGGNIIALATAGEAQRFAVGEGRLLRLDPGQAQPAWGRADAVLPLAGADWRGAGEGLGRALEDHRWTLASAVDAANQRLDALFPDPEHTFVFEFAGNRLHAQGGCNGLRGGFGIDADGMLAVTGAMSTMMACPPPLMAADAALGALLAAPLETVLVPGPQPTLALLAPGGEALLLSGELTPTARFGAPTRLFLEVAPQTVACEGSARGDGRCLQVRELAFDEQGLPVGEPGEWRDFPAEIQGYRHEAGTRNVLRVNRFGDGALYVLDLVVQSEVMPE